MKKIILLPFLFFTSFEFSQQEASNWYFGSGAGIKFLPDGSVVPLSGSPMTAQHGSATMSDANGNLLLYSNGENIWNKNHQIMSNGSGLFGNFYATQSTFILKKPSSSNLFYVFTVDLASGDKGVRYSEVDMNLNGGLGNVTANKNMPLLYPSTEKIAVIKHANGIDYWVVTHEFNSNRFFSYLVTSSGINHSGVSSNVGSIINNTPAGPISAGGGMKIAPDGSKLAVCNRFSNIELFDFSITTGKVSNAQIILNGNHESYNTEFSSDSKVLYASLSTKSVLCQFDLTSANIAASKIEITKTYPGIADIQMGINGKIYITCFPGTNNLSVINNPSVLGLGCNFQYNSVPISGSLFYGLPAFPASLFNQSFTVKKTCLGDTTEFALTTTQSVTSVIWDFGDGNTSTDIIPTHNYATAGTYTVSVKATGASGTSTNTKVITISAVPTATKPPDLLICDTNNDGFSTFDLTTQNAAILNGQDSNLYSIKYYANATDYANNVAIASPNNYVNTLPYQQQTIIAEVSNKANASCKSTTSFDIDVFDAPKPSVVIPKISSCDNASVGTDADGRVGHCPKKCVS